MLDEQDSDLRQSQADLSGELVTDSVAGEVSVEWGFKDDDTLQLTHGIHQYPARLVPQVATKLIATYSKANDYVWDPFCGSGTVLVESMVARRRAVGTDINPFACMIAKAKTTPVSRKEINKWDATIQKRLGSTTVGKRKLARDRALDTFSLDVDYWFPEAVLGELTLIRNTIRDIREDCPPSITRLFELAFARAIREASYQLPNEFKRHRRPEVDRLRHTPHPLQAFLKRWKQITDAVSEFYEDYRDYPIPEVRNEDCISFRPKESVNLIVTSPPYGDSTTTVAYGQFSSLMMEWLDFGGYDWRRIDSQCIGGDPFNPKGISKSPTLKRVVAEVSQIDPKRARVVETFLGDMRACLESFIGKLSPRGYACIVIGDRRARQVIVPNAKIIVEDAVDIGFSHVGTIDRRIFFKVRPYKVNPVARSGQKVFVPAIGKESIIILQAPPR